MRGMRSNALTLAVPCKAAAAGGARSLAGRRAGDCDQQEHGDQRDDRHADAPARRLDDQRQRRRGQEHASRTDRRADRRQPGEILRRPDARDMDTASEPQSRAAGTDQRLGDDQHRQRIRERMQDGAGDRRGEQGADGVAKIEAVECDADRQLHRGEGDVEGATEDAERPGLEPKIGGQRGRDRGRQRAIGMTDRECGHQGDEEFHDARASLRHRLRPGHSLPPGLLVASAPFVARELSVWFVADSGGRDTAEAAERHEAAGSAPDIPASVPMLPRLY